MCIAKFTRTKFNSLLSIQYYSGLSICYWFHPTHSSSSKSDQGSPLAEITVTAVLQHLQSLHLFRTNSTAKRIHPFPPSIFWDPTLRSLLRILQPSSRLTHSNTVVPSEKESVKGWKQSFVVWPPWSKCRRVFWCHRFRTWIESMTSNRWVKDSVSIFVLQTIIDTQSLVFFFSSNSVQPQLWLWTDVEWLRSFANIYLQI